MRFKPNILLAAGLLAVLLNKSMLLKTGLATHTERIAFTSDTDGNEEIYVMDGINED